MIIGVPASVFRVGQTKGEDFAVSGSTDFPVTRSPIEGAVYDRWPIDDRTPARDLETLEQARWVVGGPHGAAAKLGLKRTTLIAIMRRLDISRPIHQGGTDERGIASESIRREGAHF